MTPGEVQGQAKGGTGSHPPILILGVGNILLSDEGVGVRVIEAMKGMTLPDGVELLDGGTASTDLLDSIGNREKVVIVDAVKGDGKPGTLYRFTPDDVAVRTQGRTSLHQVGLLETLRMAKLLACLPQEVVILGIEPKEVGWGLELSAEVAATLPRVIELVLAELGVDKGGHRCLMDCVGARPAAQTGGAGGSPQRLLAPGDRT